MAENKRTALEQAYLEREQLQKQNEGASESTRVALSAISGRELLKTKAETEKIKRDREIAEQQNQALLNQGAASAAITLEKAEASQALSLENRRKNEVLTMLGRGVYDPSFAGVLGMQEGVVKEMADKKAAEIADKKAAARSQAEYEAALAEINEKKDNKKKQGSAYSSKVDDAIDAYVKDNSEITDAARAKKDIMDAANLGKPFIPWADPAGLSLNPGMSRVEMREQVVKTDPIAVKQKGLVGLNNAIASGWKEFTEPYQGKDQENSGQNQKYQKEIDRKKAQEEEELRVAREAAERYYEEALTKRIADKSAKGEGLNALERAYSSTPAGAINVARYSLENAAYENYETAYTAFADTIQKSMESVFGRYDKNENYIKASSSVRNLMESFSWKVQNGEAYTEDERATVQKQIAELEDLIAVVNGLGEDGYLETEAVATNVKAMEDMLHSLEDVDLWAEKYNKEDAKNAAMDMKHSGLTLDEMNAEVARLKAQKIDTSEEMKVLKQRGGSVEEKRKANESYQQKTAKNAQIDKEIADWTAYIKWRKEKGKQLDEDLMAQSIAAPFAGFDDIERTKNAIDAYGADIDEYNRYMNYRSYDDAQLWSLYSINPPEWLGVEVVSPEDASDRFKYSFHEGKYYSFYYKSEGGEKWELPYGESEEYVSFDELKERNVNDLEKQQALVAYYDRNIGEQSLSSEDAEKQAAEFIKNYDSQTFKMFGGKKYKYRGGSDHTYNGINHFYRDVDRFVQGDYGYFEENEVKQILAKLNGDPDIAFDYYMKLRENAVHRKAESLGGWSYVVGMNAAPIDMLIRGGFMLENASRKSYARVGSNIMSASHQVSMEKLAEINGFGGDALEFLYQGGYTIIDMAPVVGLSMIPYVGQAASSAYLYAKSFATTYDSSVRNGKRADEAVTFATLTAASEVILEKALSGLGKIGGKYALGNVFSKAVEKLATTSGVQMALKLAGKAGAEGFEEFLQEVLSPFLAKIAADVNGMTDTELEEIDWDEAGRSFLLGAFTGVGFGSVEVMSEFAARNQQDVLSQRSLIGDGADALKIIDMADALGNQRAKMIKAAIQNKSPLYEGKEGLFAYASPADITNLRISIRRRSKRQALQYIRETLQGDQNAKHVNDEQIIDIFKELLGNRSINLKQIELLLNDERAVAILNKMTGENIAALMPGDAIYLARLTAFVGEDGKVDKARMDAFRDSFGTLDFKAIEQVFKYEDLLRSEISKGNFTGIIYEDPALEKELKEEALDAVEGLKQLSEMTGTFYLVTDAFETGTYVANGVMTIKRKDLSKGAYFAMGKKAYFMTQQLDPEEGKATKDFLMKEIEQMIGADGIEAKKADLRKRVTNEGLLDDELCAEMMPAVFLQGNYKAAEKLAALDPKAAEKLRDVIGSIREHLAEEYGELIYKIENSINNQNDTSIKEQIKMNQDMLNLMDPIITLDEEIEFNNKQDVAKWILNKFKKIDFEVNRTDFGKIIIDKKRVTNSLRYYKTYEERIALAAVPDVLLYGVEIGRHIKHKGRLYDTVEFAAPVILNGVRGNLGVVVRIEGKNYYKLHRILMPDGTNFVLENKKEGTTERAGRVSDNTDWSPADNAFNNSISNYSENVNTDFYQSMKDLVSQETTELYDRLTKALDKHYGIQRAVGTDFDPSADVEGSTFVYTDSNTARKKIEAKIKQFQKQNELTPDEIEYCERVAKGGPIVEVQDASRTEIYDELIQLYMDLEVPESSVENGPRFEDMTEGEREQWFADRQSELDGYMQAVVDFADPIAKEELPDPADSVMTEVSQRKTPPKEALKKGWNWWRRKWTDSGATVYDIAKEVEDPALYHYYNAARASTNSAIYMILDKQTNVLGDTVGKGLNEIFRPVMERGDYHDFQLYLLHMHNVDRMSRQSQRATEQADAEFQIVVEAYPELSKYTDNEIRSLAHTADGELQLMAQDYMAALKNKEYWANVQNVPVFGPHVTAEDSRLQAQMLLQKHPDFKEMAEEVYRYSRNLLQYRVDSGLITKEFADKLQQIYPHYVPTARDESASIDNHVNGVRADQVQIGRSIRRLKDGGVSKIIPLHKQFADQTMAVVCEGTKNRFGTKLLEYGDKDIAGWPIKKVENVSDRILPVVTFEGQINMVDPFVTEEFKNVFTVYLNGEQYNMEVTEDLFEAIKALAPDKEAANVLTKIGRGSVDLYKKLITAYNPAFAIRNFSRDIQDALFYSKDLKGFLANYLPAIQEIKNNGELWQKYQALGGTYSSIFDFHTGMDRKQGKAAKVMGKIENINMMIEQLPRFAEFMATVKKGNGSMESLMEAMYNAADITTNFGRSGEWGKFLNRSFVPFFNPGVQGFSRAVRAVTETKGAKAWGSLILKAAALGFVPALLNGLLYHDDEEWEIINQRDKDVNYLFKIGDGLWVKIPKGRVLSVLGMTADRVKQVIQGEEVEWGEYFTTVGDQIAPANPLTANVLAGIMSVGYNKTWYGGDIVSASMQNLPAEEQYDAQTDVISVWLGNLLKISPKKINYVLDQYTGVAGDIILPALSVAEERGFWAKAFTIDSDYSNRLSGDFYDRLQELTEKKNSVDGTASDDAKYRWWNKKAGELSEINKEIKRVQADSTLTRAEKKEELDVLYASRNALILATEDDYGKYVATVDEVAKSVDLTDDDAADIIYRETNRKTFGAEVAIMMHSDAAYARAKEVRDEKGIGFDTFYDVYFDDTVNNDQTFNLIEGGLSKEGAMEISREIQLLDPEPGKESVSYLQKYKAINGANVAESEKLKAMDVLASDADRRRVKIGTEHDISMNLFVRVKENIDRLNDLDGKNSASNARIEAAIRHEDGLTDRQRAILWQLFSSSDSAKNNPFSASIGWEIVAKVKAYKASEE